MAEILIDKPNTHIIFFYKNLKGNTFCYDECPIECHTTSYSVETNLGSSINLRNSLYDGESLVNIYYEKFECTAIKQVAKITPENLFGNIGGIFGLLIGGSIMSLGEIIEFFFYMIYIMFEHGYSKIKKILRT